MQHRELPDGWDKDLPIFPADAKGMATRDSSGKVLNALAKNVPWLLGGAADLAPSTKTRLTFDGAGDFEADNYRRPQFPLRHPRARHGRDPQRHGRWSRSGLTAPAFLIFSDYGRAGHPARRPDGIAGHLRFHARFHRRRRGRPDAPAGRASRVAAGHSRL